MLIFYCVGGEVEEVAKLCDVERWVRQHRTLRPRSTRATLLGKSQFVRLSVWYPQVQWHVLAWVSI